MPLPKRRHSRTRGLKRRTHWKLQVPNLGPCPQCGTMRQPHIVCPHCGHYNGRSVINVDAS